MTSTSLFKEIESLNQEIDSCKGKIEVKSIKKSSCPPNCYCDKRLGLENRTTTSTRKKTATATVIKCDITPRRFQDKVESTKPAANLKKQHSRPKTASDIYDHNYYEEIQSCPRAKKDAVPQGSPVQRRCSKEQQHIFFDNSIEPVKLSKKCQHIKKEPSWSSILQQNNQKDKENCNISPRSNHYPTYRNSSSSSSAVSSVALETVPIYMKSKGIQCDEIPIPPQLSMPDVRSVQKNDPLNIMQYLIMNLKDKVKDSPDPSLGNMLDEMEDILSRIPLDRGDNQAMNEAPIECRHVSIDKYLNPRPDYYTLKTPRERLEDTYRELEATCAKLKKERDSALEKASLKSTELVESMRREAETKSKLSETNLKIKTMSAKLETYTRSMEGLTEHVKRLQNENKDLERIRGQVCQLSKMMRDVTQENKSLLAEIQLLIIERNKLEVELAMKEQDLERKSKKVENLSQALLENARSSNARVEDDKRSIMISNNLDLYSRSGRHTIRNESPREDSPQLVSSSPNTSSSDSVLRARLDSWIAFSTIAGDAGIEEENQIDLEQPVAVNRQSIKTISQINNNHTVINNNRNNNIEPSSLGGRNTPIRNNEKRPDVDKIEKLKDEICRMFTEMRELAHDVPSIPVVEFSPMDGDSSDINWSEMSNTNNSYDSVTDLQSSDFNDFLERNKFKL